jgi:hypothetical protein
MQRIALAFHLNRVGTSNPFTPGQKANQFLKLYVVFGTVDYGIAAETEY